MEIIRVAVIGLIGALLATSVKNTKSEFTMYISLGTCVILLFYVVSRLSGIIEQVRGLSEYIVLDADYIAVLLKMAGITYVAEFSSALCKDMGYSALAVQIENFGKLSLLAVSCPVIIRLLELIGEMA